MKVGAGTRAFSFKLARGSTALAAGRYRLVISLTANGRTSTLTRVLRVTPAR
jgi:hypothetical protein